MQFPLNRLKSRIQFISYYQLNQKKKIITTGGLYLKKNLFRNRFYIMFLFYKNLATNLTHHLKLHYIPTIIKSNTFHKNLNAMLIGEQK